MSLLLNKAIRHLENFKANSEIANLISMIETQKTSEQADSEKLMSALRNQLNQVLSDERNDKHVSNGGTLADVAYEVLLILADFSPLNDEDVITLESIGGKRIFVSTGYQYNHELLIQKFTNPATGLL